LATLALLVAGCRAYVVPATSTAATPPTTPAVTAAVGSPAAQARYLTIDLTDVRTGERFTLGGFGGKTVIVEGMAVW
jgi:hypothetical protein